MKSASHSSKSGRLIAVVGPSGVGKDSVMRGLCDALPRLHPVRRVITRLPGQGGEDYDAVSVSAFQDMAVNGAFAIHWEAHGLCYGIPSSVMDRLKGGTDCIANLSRTALPDAARSFANFTVLNITAQPETLAARLAARGRETEDEVAKRLAQSQKPLPAGMEVITLCNEGPLDQTIARATDLLWPARVPQ